MKPGDLVRIHSSLLSASFFQDFEGIDICWDGSSVIKRDQIMVVLGEEIVRFTCYAQVHCSGTGKVGYVKMNYLEKVT